ncbi:MAG: YbaB/EbfC family nucleoid-associated protein [Patescibacteria group bacterium]|nr:MAG: YbaB/EbfC family nucleoid-associated protein [Patescibacteria group bacterium]
MFQKLKQIKDLRSQAKTMQSALAEEIVTNEDGGVKITLDGNLEVKSVVIGDGMTKAQIEQATLKSVNNAIKKAQKVMAEKMKAMGGLEKFGL